MPGLIGVVGPENRQKSQKLIENMASALEHEDRYRVDLWTGDNVALGRVHLGYVNPEPQPIWNEDHSLCIVMEGEIYDYDEERRKLIEQGHCFRVDNDSEFVLHLYEEFGEEFASHLNGAFVAAIWDRRANRLVLANDRFGLHPLYYAQCTNRLTFASGLHALLANPALSRRIDPIAVAQFLSFEHVLGNRTLLAEADLMPPASLLTFCDGHLTIRSYWSLEFADVYQPHSEETYLEDLTHHMRQAVARQAHDNLPAGMLLSGGLDSRIIVALLHNNLASGSLHTFTFGIPDCDDARFAREVAALLGAQHHFFELKSDYLLGVAEEGVRLTGGLYSCIHMHALASLQAEAKYVRVIYKGYMGDSLMGSHLNRQLWASYDEDTLNRMLFEHTNNSFRQAEWEDLFAEDFQHQINGAFFDSFRATSVEAKATLVANRQTHFDLRQRQRRFILSGLEMVRSQAIVRAPFCDNDLVEFMLTVPPGLRLDRFLFKKALVRAFPDLAKVPYEKTGLPLVACARDLRIRIDKQVRWRLHTAGLKWISVPHNRPYADYNGWMRTVLRDWTEETLLNKRTLERGYFDPDFIRNLVAEHMAGADHTCKLGVLLALELWHRMFLD